MSSTIRAIRELPDDLDELARAAASEGFGMVRRLIDDFASGSNRFALPGEGLYVVQEGGVLVAVGGINIDPYYDLPSLGRIRHVYVHPDCRRAGLGRCLMERIERHGARRFERFQLFTTSAKAGRFYEAQGYSPVEGQWKVSHSKRWLPI